MIDLAQMAVTLSRLDILALLFFLLSFLGSGLVIENAPTMRPSVTTLMSQYRREWMEELITREPRIFDATILSTLRQGTTFFGSSCLIAIGGVLAMLGNTDRLIDVAADFPLPVQTAAYWEMKLLLIALLLMYAFLKFVWSNRLFGYCAVVMAAVPNAAGAKADLRASQAAELNIRAAWNFNRGLRGIYFGLAALGWLMGPVVLIITTVVTLYTLLAREFMSHSRTQLLQTLTPPDVP